MSGDGALFPEDGEDSTMADDVLNGTVSNGSSNKKRLSRGHNGMATEDLGVIGEFRDESAVDLGSHL